MFLSFIVGATIPTIPLLMPDQNLALLVSWLASIVTLLGTFKGILTRRPLVGSGLEFAAVALGSAGAG